MSWSTTRRPATRRGTAIARPYRALEPFRLELDPQRGDRSQHLEILEGRAIGRVVREKGALTLGEELARRAFIGGDLPYLFIVGRAFLRRRADIAPGHSVNLHAEPLIGPKLVRELAGSTGRILTTVSPFSP